GIRHWVLEVEIKKAHERQAVADQVLGLLIREIVERLQHHDLELQDRIVGLATSVALALLGLRLGHALDVSAEVLPPHDLLDRFQRIAFGADRLKPALNIEKARLPHDSLARAAHGALRSARQIRSDLARRIFRGALHTDQDEVLFGSKRPIILNGIDDIATRPALADRAIVQALAASSDEKPELQTELWAKFE